MATLRVLVFGSTGTGKTSLCNTLTAHERPAADSAVGVTFSSFVFPAIRFAGHTIHITDTAGLNESDKGRIKPVAAVQQLVELIKHSAAGYHLLIHVMRAPRITQTHADNYEFFVKHLTQGKVPCVLVVNGCENSDPMFAWADANKPVFAEQGFEYKDVLATCFAAGGRFETAYAPLREESRTAVLKAIVTYYSTAKALYKDEPGFFEVLKRARNRFCLWIGQPEFQFIVNKGIKNLLTRVGVPEKLAKALASGIGRNITGPSRDRGRKRSRADA